MSRNAVRSPTVRRLRAVSLAGSIVLAPFAHAQVDPQADAPAAATARVHVERSR